ncbi:hypothetical protein [Aquabacterium sp. CECT 9606]|uniref:hypothetical protein n=1 Tax=Aquabacterium sp. CECT 9606 TaxID=2845822 RepID=UPI001E5A7A77|nr:hypothetical protein [Aquabacterium sp. CECT 9606]CAH0354933.1 hypothetical protein AQB9606_04061 [Aquabacterium sp. CECT 9606]
MKRIFFASSLAASLLITGCASSPTSTDRTQAADTADTPPIAAAVAVPAAAKRKVVLALTGPKAITESKDWGEFKREWRETFAEHASEASVAYSFSDAAPSPTGEDGTILLVDVADYRIVGIGARIFFGAMTGNAFIDAKVKFSSLRDGAAFGEQRYNTSSSAWGGIFAKMTPQQVDSIASNIFMDLGGAK